MNERFGSGAKRRPGSRGRVGQEAVGREDNGLCQGRSENESGVPRLGLAAAASPPERATG